MKKIISLFLALLLFTSNIFFIVSCNKEPIEPTIPGVCEEHNDGDGDGFCDFCKAELIIEEEPPKSEIRVPEYKDYLRGTKNFEELVYSRPDIDAAVTLLASVAELIEKNEIAYEEQLKKLYEIDEIYINIDSMISLATIFSYKDSTNEYFAAEYEYLTTNYPKFSQGIEKIFVSAANSPFCTQFEIDFFGEGLEEYKDGGIYTDTLVKLMEDEALLEAEYSALSTANVKITYEGKTDTYDAIIAFYKEKHGEDSTEFLKVKTLCDGLFAEALSIIESELLVKLIKTRKLISDALGYESYEKFAYDTLYHDYSPAKMKKFIDCVPEIVVPVYLNLYGELFYPYVNDYEKTVAANKASKTEILNALYDIYTESDAKLGEIYSYMLQHKLYDIEEFNNYRFGTSFTTYIESNASPFLFITLGGTMLDYTTVAHEFGHFVDGYINYNSQASLDTLEISSQALELLTLTKLDGKFDEKTYKYLLYLKLEEVLSTIIFQSFYASFEAEAYALDYDDITLENLNAIVASTAKKFGFSSICNSVEYVSVPHIFLYPFYVQSYSTSAVAALEIYTLEIKNPGDGFDAYNSFVTRDIENLLTFEEALSSASLSSPFEKTAIKKILNELHYATLGAYYFKTHNGNEA